MKYGIVVIDPNKQAERYEAALKGLSDKPRTVYVVGVDDSTEYALALSNQSAQGVITLDDLNAETVMQFAFSEAIGTEDRFRGLEALVRFAQARIATLRQGAK